MKLRIMRYTGTFINLLLSLSRKIDVIIPQSLKTGIFKSNYLSNFNTLCQITFFFIINQLFKT